MRDRHCRKKWLPGGIRLSILGGPIVRLDRIKLHGRCVKRHVLGVFGYAILDPIQMHNVASKCLPKKFS